MHGNCWMTSISTRFNDGEGNDGYEGWRAKDLSFILIGRGEACDQKALRLEISCLHVCHNVRLAAESGHTRW